MASGTIKGITIEFNGDTTKLSKALNEIDKKAKGLDQAFREVNRALKFNPRNAELLGQKQELLKQKIERTTQQLEAFKKAEQTMKDNKVEETSQEFMECRRNIIECESKLRTFNAQLNRMKYANVERVGKAFQSAGQKMRTAGMYATIAGGAMVLAGKKVLEYSTVQNQAETKLTEVYKSRMHATEAAAKSTMKLASAIQKEGIIGDEVTLTGAQQLATFAKYPSTVNKILPAMDNLLAQQKGYNATADDARNIANMLGKALQGQTGALSRVGITFDEAQKKILKTGTEEQKAAVLAEILTQNVGNMNKKLAETPEGKIQQLKNSLGDIAERFGNVLLPVLGKVADYISNNILPKVEQFMAYLEKNPAIAKLVVGLTALLTIGGPVLAMLGAMSSGIGALLGNFGKISGAISGLGGLLRTFMAGPIGLVVAGAAAVVAGLVLLYNKSKTFREAVNGLVDALGKAFKPILTAISQAFKELGPVISSLVKTLGSALAPIIKALTPALTAIANVITSIAKVVIPILTKAIQAIVQVVDGVVKAVSITFGYLEKFFAKVANAIAKTIAPIFKKIAKFITNPIQSAKNLVSSVVSKIKSLLNFSGLVNKVKKIWDTIKEKVTAPFRKAKEVIQNVVDKIKSWFPINLGKLFSFQLPHIHKNAGKKNGEFAFGATWHNNAEGGIFSKPTLFPNGNTFERVGEAGAEAILPLKKLWNQMDKMNERMIASIGSQNVTANYYITVDGSKDPAQFAAELFESLKLQMRTV